jgi:hypothetical protein
MIPKRLEWTKCGEMETAKAGGMIASIVFTVREDETREGNQWILWIERFTVLLKRIEYDTKAEAKLAGEQIWRRMVMELLEGDE